MARLRVVFEGEVHLVGPNSEFTLCSVAFDAADSENEPTLRWMPTRQRIVTCPECVRVIVHCRNVPVGKHGRR